MNLVRAEAARILARRFTRLMVVVLLATFVVTILVVLGKSKQPTEEMWENARSIAANVESSRRLEYSTCLQTHTAGECEELNPDRVVPENYLWGVFNFAREIGALVAFLTAFLAFFGFLIAASFIGSELHSGGVINLLLWRPNRAAVLGAKFGVAMAFIAAVSVVFSILFVGTFYALAGGTGWIGDADVPGFWSSLALLCLRGIGLALIVSAVGFAVATIARHTAAALGVLFGYLVIWELGARLIVETLNLNNSNTGRDSWFLASHVSTWMAGRDNTYSLTSFTDAALVFAVIVGGLTALAFTTFRRRDIT
ncbi:MAG TPA: ABC transporter permease subunit [Candidatus Limnocylindrales bacterium]